MRLSTEELNRIVNDLASRLDGGLLAIYDGASFTDPSSFLDPLVVVPLPSPAFDAAVDGQAISFELAPADTIRTGEAGTARLVTAAGDVIADLSVRARSDQNADLADIVLDRLDLHRGGRVVTGQIVLVMPRSW